MHDSLELPLEKFISLQPRVQKRLLKLGIKTVRDLLYHFPRRYIDYSKILPIAHLMEGQMVTIQGTVKKISGRYAWGRRGMTIIELILEDASGTIPAIWFNQRYLLKTFHEGEHVSLSGKVNRGKRGLYLLHPEHEILRESGSKNQELDSRFTIQNSALRHTGRLVPVYSETAGLTSRWLRFLARQTLTKLPHQGLPDPIPAKILVEENFMSLKNAFFAIHFPRTESEAKRAKKRFLFEEVFLLQLKKELSIRELKRAQAPVLRVSTAEEKSAVDAVPFILTQAQKNALKDALKDLGNPYPMNRLLNGDVGSGKTVVAALLAHFCILRGWQTVFMAPTEILAQQHFQTIKKLFPYSNWTLALITSSQKKVATPYGEIEKANIARMVKNGDIHFAVGTHALLESSLAFKNLGLVIIDEQHRFGVGQRATLVARGYTPKNTRPNAKNGDAQFAMRHEQKMTPHFLSLTATPIPRTLALTLYGDLSISVINELPRGRNLIITKIVSPARRNAAYEFVEKEIRNGRQAFVICPRIESPEENTETKDQKTALKKELKSVKAEYKKLSEAVFPSFSIACLHGKLKPKEKEKIMREFKEGSVRILVATSVVEVGIDVPNASVMIIEGAERFGLAQLHQFRGRVGRSAHQSYCFLFPSEETPELNARLKAVALAKDGFQLAEMDLKLRGPGNLVGYEQSGFNMPLQEALTDLTLVERTAKAAQKIIGSDPEFKKYPLLKNRLQNIDYVLHQE